MFTLFVLNAKLNNINFQVKSFQALKYLVSLK